MVFRKRMLFLVFSLSVPLLLVLCLILYSSQTDKGDFFSTLKALYGSEQFEKAQSRLELSLEEVLAQKEGCELALSIYAKQKEYSALYRVASRCLELGRKVDLAYEALAFSSLKLGADKEALKILKKELQDSSSDRLLLTLGQLTHEQKDFPQSRTYFLRLIKESNMWATWMARLLKFKPLMQDPVFIDELVLEVSEKKNRSKQSEEKLLMYAKLFKLSTSIQILEKRLGEK